MTTKEIAEMIFGRLIECRTKEYSSINRSLRSLEKEGIVQRVFVQLRWRRTPQASKIETANRAREEQTVQKPTEADDRTPQAGKATSEP